MEDFKSKNLSFHSNNSGHQGLRQSQIGMALASDGVDNDGEHLLERTESIGELPEDILTLLDEIQKFPNDGENPRAEKMRTSMDDGIWSHHHSRNTARREPFNPNTYTTFNFKLKKLHNLRTSTSESTGDYIIRICFMGRVLGEYMSGPIDLISLTQLSRHSSRISKHLHCPSITLGHELSMHLRFRDLLDNPVLLTLAVKGTNEFDEPFLPFAYTCLNMIELVNKGDGKSRKIHQLWILVPERTPLDLVSGFPLISLDILGFTGLPTSEQLKQGNIMSVIIESMYRLPQEVLNLVNTPESAQNMDIHFTLPHSKSEYESTLVFPGGHLKKIISSRVAEEMGVGGKRKSRTSRTSASATAVSGSASAKEHVVTASSTSTVFNLPDSIDPRPIQVTDGVPVYTETRSYRHWASVLDYFPEAPYAASIVTGKQKIPKIKETIEAIGDIDKSGDSWRGHLASSDTRIVWNSLHRHYIGLEAYKQMLERLSKQTIWPLEVAITIQRPLRPSLKTEIPDELNDPPLPRESALSETVVIYHGVAFVDMTHLLYPGIRRSRFIYQLFPFNDILFKAKTCAMKSAFLQTIRNSIDEITISSSTTKKLGDIDGPSTNQFRARRSIVRHTTKDKDKDKVVDKLKSSNINTNTNTRTSPYESKLTSKEDLNAVRVSLLDESQLSTLPFIIFHIRLRRALIPSVESIPVHAVEKTLNHDHQITKFPRKKLMNSITAEKQFRSSVLEASADLSQEFHTTFLNTVIKDGVAKGYLDASKPASSVESIKKHFLFHLNASGKYLVLREHLRHSVSKIIQQKCTNLQPNGFSSRREFQQFLHDLYLFLVDEMHETLNATALKEVDPIANFSGRSQKHSTTSTRTKKRCKKSKRSKSAGNKSHTGSDKKLRKPKIKRRRGGKNLERLAKLDQLLMFSQESFAQGDYENAHRIHVERVARSGESSNCWADFAIMWLGRGDDRLAEIALRESLLKNPKNVKALVMSGVIAARHSDNRAIICLGAALNLIPNSPELMVLLAMAHSCLGNDVAAEYFFKKARFVHHILTGRNLSGIESEFLEKSAHLPKDLAHASIKLDQDEKSKRYSIRPPVVASDPDLEDVKPSEEVDESSGLKFNENEDGGGGITNVGTEYVTYEGIKKRRDSKNRENHYNFPQHYHFNTQTPDFKFLTLVHEIKSSENTRLPSMGPSLACTWNVTKRSKGDTTRRPDDPYSAKLATNSEIKTEFDKVAYAAQFGVDGAPEDMTHIWTRDQLGKMANGPYNLLKSPDGDEIDGETESVGDPEVGPRKNRHHHAGISIKLTRPSSPHNTSKYRKPEENKIYTRRIGSELLWTAHVLLKLRLFDFLDGVLARELAFNPDRSVEVLYLRALSLHMRLRDGEAIGFLHEAIEKSPKNNVLWALRGHCYYNLKMHKDTYDSYEKTLKLPHGKVNLQLVYLRFGTQCLEKGLVTLAKKVFLKGVHSFPSPYIWIAMGNTCYHMKEYPQAETSFAEANRLDNTNPIIWAHLSLVSLALGHQTLAEHSYKWAIRFGLKQGCRLMNELQQLHRETHGFGSPSFQRIPSCIPHQYYLQRLGKEHPFEEYKQALQFSETANHVSKEYENSERENELIKRLQEMKPPIGKAVLEQVAKNNLEKLEKEKLELAAAEETAGEEPHDLDKLRFPLPAKSQTPLSSAKGAGKGKGSKNNNQPTSSKSKIVRTAPAALPGQTPMSKRKSASKIL